MRPSWPAGLRRHHPGAPGGPGPRRALPVDLLTVPPGAAWDEGSDWPPVSRERAAAMTNLAGMVQARAARAGQRERPARRRGGQAGAAGPERS